MSTEVAVPQGIVLPVHLMTAEAARAVAEANAAAAGGIRIGGFPKISIEGGKFHEIDASVDGGNPRTYMLAALPGQPPLPMMCLEAVVIAANPNLIKTYYATKWVRGQAEAPDCQSTNGVVPDAGVPKPQSAVCATCPQNQWGSKISEATGKEIKACSDSKQMVVLPGADLNYKALGLAVTPSALGDWGKYVKALSDRNIPVTSVVTNITFDHTAAYPKLKFAFNRFLTAEEYAHVQQRAQGDDVKLIVSPTRTAPPALLAPAAAQPVVPTAPAPAPVAPTPPEPASTRFGAAQPAALPAATAPATAPVPRKRRTRAEIEAANAATNPPAAAPAADLSHLPPAIKAAVEACGVDSVAGKAMIAQFAKPTVATEKAPAEGDKPQPSGVVPAPVAATAAVTSSGAKLRDLLATKLGLPKQAG